MIVGVLSLFISKNEFVPESRSVVLEKLLLIVRRWLVLQEEFVGLED